MRAHTEKNVDDIYNAMMKPGGKSADGSLDRGYPVSAMAQENLKLESLSISS